MNKKTVGRGEVKTVRRKSFMDDELKGRGIQETNVSQQKWEDVYKVENKTLDPKARWKIIEGVVTDFRNEISCVSIEVNDKTYEFDYVIDCSGSPSIDDENYFKVING